VIDTQEISGNAQKIRRDGLDRLSGGVKGGGRGRGGPGDSENLESMTGGKSVTEG